VAASGLRQDAPSGAAGNLPEGSGVVEGSCATSGVAEALQHGLGSFSGG
jgi:hypothetical protein